MRRVLPTVFLLFAASLCFLAIFSGESYSRLHELQNLLSTQREANQELQRKVVGLKREIYGLNNDSRSLEKAARNELNLARPDEMVFIFDE